MREGREGRARGTLKRAAGGTISSEINVVQRIAAVEHTGFDSLQSLARALIAEDDSRCLSVARASGAVGGRAIPSVSQWALVVACFQVRRPAEAVGG